MIGYDVKFWVVLFVPNSAIYVVYG